MAKVVRYLLSYEKLETWFRECTETNQSPWYEIAATNYIAQNAHLISGVAPARVWVEMKLGSEEEGSASHPDVIIETESELFVVEVKYTYSVDDIDEAENQALDYIEQIENIGWWPHLKPKHAIVVWAYYDVIPTRGIKL